MEQIKPILAFGVPLAMFTVTMLFYAMGLVLGWCTWSGMFLLAVLVPDVMIGFLIWSLWSN
jgi:hypothetical protein